MLKEAFQYLVSLKENKTYEIHGDTYSDHELVRIPVNVDRPNELEVNGLDSIVKLVRTELEMMENFPVFIRVADPRRVNVFSTLDTVMGRDRLYCAVCDAPDFRGGWREQEEAIIQLRSAFVPNEDTQYLLDLLSRIRKEEGVTTVDNGVSQSVEARAGVQLKQMVPVKPRVSLCPYRTFTEIEQPESEFILRLNENAGVGLFEADGGRWRLEAKRRIANYFEKMLAKEIEVGYVVVMV